MRKDCLKVLGVEYEMKLRASDVRGYYLYELRPFDRTRKNLLMYISPDGKEYWNGVPHNGGCRISRSDILYFYTY